MNGIALLLPPLGVKIGFFVLLILNVLVFCRIVLPTDQKEFAKKTPRQSNHKGRKGQAPRRCRL